MAFYEIHFTPIKSNLRSINENNAALEITPKLTLAPFNRTPEVDFGNVPINGFATKYFDLYNPSKLSMKLQLIQDNLIDDRIKCSENDICLASLEVKRIEVTWCPDREYDFRKVLHINDFAIRSRTYDVVLKGKCINLTHVKQYKGVSGKSRKTKHGPQTKTARNKMNAMKVLNRTVVINKTNNFENVVSTHGEKENSPIASSSPISKFRHPEDLLLEDVFSGTKDSIGILGTPVNLRSIGIEMKEFLSAMDKIGLSPEVGGLNRRSTFAKDSTNLQHLPSLPSVKNDYKISPNSPQFSDSLDSGGSQKTSYKTCLTSPLSSNTDEYVTPQTHKNTTFDSEGDCVINADTTLNISEKSVGSLFVISPPIVRKIEERKRNSPRSRKVIHRVGTLRSKLHTPSSSLSKKKKILSPKSSSCKKKLNAKNSIYLANSEDPFFKLLAYHDEEWLDQQEVGIIKWINSILSPSIEMESSERWTADDVADIWMKSSTETDIKLAPSKEYFASVLYHCPQHLDTLRKIASVFYRSDPIASVLTKLSAAIEKKVIGIRDDRDLHLDQGLRFKLFQLLSSYNPLWLRIGLEVIYDQKIPVIAKCDIGGFGNFIRKNLFINEYINKKHSHPTVVNMKLPTFKDAMKKFILKKFLMLIYFLDKAKLKKLIRHDPCLFLKKSEYKSSNDLLLAFCSDLVVGHGDVIKHLKYMNYTLTYKQTYLDEYDYSIPNLLALRDGVHINRLLEILIGPSADLCSKLRVPAISLLQKQHNVKIALEALEKVCTIKGNIKPQDIARGYREKILSLLWQIIHNYITPRYNKAATRIQMWWRCARFRREISKRIQRKNRQRTAILTIETWWRRTSLTREINRRICRRLTREQAARLPTDAFRRLYYQLWCKYNSAVNQPSADEILVSCAVIIVQRKFRARCRMLECRTQFRRLKMAVLIVQRRYRANKSMFAVCQRYRELKYYVDRMKARWIANKLAAKIRAEFLALRNATLFVQRRYRSNRLSAADRFSFQQTKLAAVTIQRRFRANMLMKKQRQAYLSIKRASVTIQHWYRAVCIGSSIRADFLLLRKATVYIQRRYRANRLSISCRLSFQRTKLTVMTIQRRFRAILLMREHRAAYLSTKHATVTVQRWYRATRQMREERDRYNRLKEAAITIQNHYRAYKLAREQRREFLKLKAAIRLIESRYRDRTLMLRQMNTYQNLRQSAITIQQHYRATVRMRKDRAEFVELRTAVNVIKNRYRANKLMAARRNEFLRLKSAAILVQRRYRANRLGRKCRVDFLNLKLAVTVIESRYTANKLARSERTRFVNLRSATLSVQRTYRSKTIRERFLALKKAATVVQRRYRALKKMRKVQSDFLTLKRKVVLIQRWYRNCLLVPRCKEDFIRKRSAVLVIQRKYRAYRAVKEQRLNFLQIRSAAITIQSCYRAWKVRRPFVKLRKWTIFIQRTYRIKLQQRLVEVNEAAVVIQAAWRGYKVRKLRLLKKFVMPVRRNEKYLTKGTLNERYGNAVMLLQTSDMYNVVIKALYNLETITSLSGKLCEDLTEDDLVNLIMGFLKRTNRSLPSLELCRVGISVLINLVRHKPTATVVWFAMKEFEYEGILQLVHIMKYMHDKSSDPLFLYASTLLWLLIDDKTVAQEILKIPIIVKQLEQMFLNVNRKFSTSRKARKTHPVTPSLIPCWLTTFKYAFFDDYCHAINSICWKLDIRRQ